MSVVVVKNMTTYEMVTKRIVEAIKKNKAVPWRRPWATEEIGFPSNLASKRPYRGINLFLLSMMNYSSLWWITFNQAKTLGGSIKKGEHGTPVIFWSLIEKRNEKTSEIEKIPFLRHSTVFNVEQCEGITVPPSESHDSKPLNPIESCEAIVGGFDNPPEITERGQSAYYSITQDLVNIPSRERFTSIEEYYSTMFHELVHATAHPSRLDRKLIPAQSSFFSQDYSKEELIAEMGCSLLCAKAGIDSATFDNSVAYLQGWVAALTEKPRMLIEAASAAQKACDLILGTKEQKEEQEVGI